MMRTEGLNAAAMTMLAALGIEYEGPEDEMVQHAMVMCQAMLLLAQKARGYGSSWKRVGYAGTVLKISMKTERLLNALWYREPSQIAQNDEGPFDTFLDLLNYAVFGYQQYAWKDRYGRGH